VIVLDAYAVIAFLRDEPAADEVASLMRSDDASLTAVGVGEVVDHLIRLAGVDEDDVFLDLAELGLHDALPIDAQAGARAGRLRGRYYHRTRCAVSMADCLAAAVAHDRAIPLATSDPHLLELCHAGSIDTVVLPGSNGARWTPSS
jgi:predicted nucleic acid-binding protein